MKPFVVLGCPRSGTSLVAGMLHRSGIRMSYGTFAGKTERNPTGYWEDVSIVSYNDQVLRKAGTHHLAPPQRGIEMKHRFKNKILVRLRNRRERPGSGGWGWKDPRCIFLWEHYQEIIRAEFGGARIVVTHRNLLHIARSWEMYGPVNVGGSNKVSVGLERGLRLAVEYEARLADVYESRFPMLHVAFEDWWRRRDAQREKLEEFIGRELNFSLFDEKLWRS